MAQKKGNSANFVDQLENVYNDNCRRFNKKLYEGLACVSDNPRV